MTKPRSHWSWLPLAGALMAPQLEAQEVPLHKVQQATARYADGLGSLRGVRELSDGRVLIADGLGEALIVWTPGGTADTLTNVGQGPEEYRVPDGLFPLPGDATLLVDIGNARLVEIGPDLSFGETTPIAQGQIGPGMTLLLPVGTDDAGRIYYQQRVGGMMDAADSALIMRFEPSTESSTQLGKSKLPAQQRETSGGANNRREVVRPLPLQPQDAWGPAANGRVGVARANPYRFDWIGTDGRLISGPSVAYEPVRVRSADREEWLESLSGGLGVMVSQTNQGAPQLAFRRGGMGGPGGGANADDFQWPDVKPAFPPNAVRVAPDGRAWVLRYRPAGQPALYDVFGADGRRVAQVELPPDRELAGFGAGALYLSRTDELDFAWLERYRAPAF